jgi:hypothetical protein
VIPRHEKCLWKALDLCYKSSREVVSFFRFAYQKAKFSGPKVNFDVETYFFLTLWKSIFLICAASACCVCVCVCSVLSVSYVLCVSCMCCLHCVCCVVCV